MSYRQPYPLVRPGAATVIRTVLVALLAGTAFGVVLTRTGRLGAVTALYGIEAVDAWPLVYVHSLVASAGFVAVLSRLARSRYAPLPVQEAVRNPFPGACVGLGYGVVLWLAVVAYGAPLWLNTVTGAQLSTPYYHPESLPALLAFGAVLGASYPVVRAHVTDPS